MSEKILGVIISNDLTWKHHFYGEPEKNKEDRSEGLLTSLAKRVGVLKQIARYAKGPSLRSLAQGLFYSKLCYSLPIIAKVWIKEMYKDRPDVKLSTKREEYRKLQVLQNKVEKEIYKRENGVNEQQIKNIPTEILLKSNKMQSIHQMGAQSILNMFGKIINSKKPNQLSQKLSRQDGRHGPTWKISKTPRLTITSSSLL